MDELLTDVHHDQQPFAEAAEQTLQEKIDAIPATGFATQEQIQKVIDSIPLTSLQEKINAVPSTGAFATPEQIKAALDLAPKRPDVEGFATQEQIEKVTEEAFNARIESMIARSKLLAQELHDQPIETAAAPKKLLSILDTVYPMVKQRRIDRQQRRSIFV